MCATTEEVFARHDLIVATASTRLARSSQPKIPAWTWFVLTKCLLKLRS